MNLNKIIVLITVSIIIALKNNNFCHASPALEQNDTKTGPIMAGEEMKVLVDEAVDWAHKVGAIMRTKDEADKSDIMQFAPMSLFPSPVPRKMFQQAMDVQKAMNLLYFRVSSDYAFMAEALKEVGQTDVTTRTILDIMHQAEAEGRQPPVRLLLERADYQFHEDKSAQDEDKRYQLKQIELNIGPIGGNLTERVTEFHRRVLAKGSMCTTEDRLPVNRPTNTMAQGLYLAWQKFGNPDALLVIVYHGPSTLVITEHRMVEYELEELSKNKIKIARLSVAECGERLKLAEDGDFSLSLDGQLVGLVYFRGTFLVRKNPKTWDTRRMIERSTAIKVPTMAQELSSTKKMQQILAQPGMVERFFQDPKDKDKVAAIRATFAGLWGLDRDDEETKAVIQDAIVHPDKYVLKPNREGGGNNIWGQAISDKLKELKHEERADFILMQKLEPMVVKNYFLRPKMPLEFGDVIVELSIFGALVSMDGKVIHNQCQGHLMRTKWANVHEGGILKMTGVFDSPYLV